jgi:signal transduction histidine kinase/DNA-binding response OmpR family regulator
VIPSRGGAARADECAAALRAADARAFRWDPQADPAGAQAWLAQLAPADADAWRERAALVRRPGSSAPLQWTVQPADGSPPRLLVGTAWRDAEGRLARVEGLLLPAPAPATPGLAPAEVGVDAIAMVSHELRTPLNAIVGFARLAQAALPEAPQRALLDPVLHASDLMLRVVGDLLDLARLEAGRLEIDADQPLHLPALVARVGEFAGGLRNDKPVAVHAIVDPACPAMLRGDRQRIEQILVNLVGNALKFTDRGDVVLRVRLLGCRDDRVRLRFAVSDTGRGIALGDLDRLGRPFEQAAGGGLPRPEGAGLGLAIVRRLLELHGTQLRVASVDGGGTLAWFDVELLPDRLAAEPEPAPGAVVHTACDRFLGSIATQWRAEGERAVAADGGGASAVLAVVDLALPDAAARCAAERAAGRRVLVVSAVPRTTGDAGDGPVPLSRAGAHAFADRRVQADPLEADPALAGMRVLVVEDNPLNQQVAAGMLLRLGVGVRIAGDVGSAIAWMEREYFDLALVDLHLPDGTGFDVLRARLPRLPPVVLCSAHLGAEDELEALQRGALASIAKPLLPERLRRLLHGVRTGVAPAPVDEPIPTMPAPLLPGVADLWAGQRPLLIGALEAARAQGATAALREAVHALRGALSVLPQSRAARVFARQVEEGLVAGADPSTLPLDALIAAVPGAD